MIRRALSGAGNRAFSRLEDSMEKTNSPAKERLVTLFDAGTFVELGAYLRRPGHPEAESGVVCGYGAVEGRLIFAFAEDAAAMKGAVDASHAAKIADLYEKALRAGAPVIGMFDSAGAVVFDGAAALGGYATLLSAAANAKGKIPQIAVICGACVGTMAAVAGLFDFTVAVKNESRMYLPTAHPQKDRTGCAEELFANGAAAILAADEAEAFALVRTLLSYLPDNANSGTPADISTDDINRALPEAESLGAVEALNAVADAGHLLTLSDGAGEETKVGFALLGGCSAAVIAIDGELTLAGVRKMTAILNFAGAFSLPVVSFVNCGGFAAGEENAELLQALPALTLAWNQTENAKIVALTGKAIGAGFLFGGARRLGADMVLALPGAEIAALRAETGVAFLWNDRISGTVSREALETEWKETVATAENAAATGEVDDIIPGAELRARLISAVYMLADRQAL